MTQAQVRQMFIHNNPGVRRLGRKGYWYRCAHCGRWCGRDNREHAGLKDSEKMEVDHIQSWAHGGSDALWNLQPLCKPCNRSKSADPTLKDSMKILKNNIMHPIDGVTTSIRRTVRNTGISRRK